MKQQRQFRIQTTNSVKGEILKKTQAEMKKDLKILIN